jgi:hypothetical protein
MNKRVPRTTLLFIAMALPVVAEDAPAIGSAEEFGTFCKAREDLVAAWRKKEISLSGEDIPLLEAFRRIGEETGLEVKFGKEAEEAAKFVVLTLNFSDVTGDNVLAYMVEVTGFELVPDKEGKAWLARGEDAASFGVPGWRTYRALKEAETARLLESEEEKSKREKAEAELLAKPVGLEGKDLSTRQVGELLEKALGVPCRLDGMAWNSRKAWTLGGGSRPAAEIVGELTAGYKVDVFFGGGVLWILGDPLEE